ncbi:uncharacterized protein SCDLUD_002338 [Saccharomycodes ludwigii]|uniref:uncharacterized protein n=1 Tax=Saccharomycodes ludwigii TaxID=36035 RepID=UPI001E8473EF|nr:hypothetical protein SCDLUD_002338 [Saccharomycodes ludwigii]KAH3900881.1 hypothetical protein SCDLUD_002338 [Saccharomycodes ludwigii]
MSEYQEVPLDEDYTNEDDVYSLEEDPSDPIAKTTTAATSVAPNSTSQNNSNTPDYLFDSEEDDLDIDSNEHWLSENGVKILPKTDYHSPFHIGVPTPKGSNISIEPNLNSNKSDYYSSSSSSSATAVPENPEPYSNSASQYPTTVVIDRFTKWKKILKGLILYFKDVVIAQEEYAKINLRLKNSVKFQFLTNLTDNNTIVEPLLPNMSAVVNSNSSTTTVNGNNSSNNLYKLNTNASAATTSRPSLKSFSSSNSLNTIPVFNKKSVELDGNNASGFLPFGSGSIQDIQVLLKKYHVSLAKRQIISCKEITAYIIPRLEELKNDLQVKIKEIKDLHDDFKTNIQEHVALTGQLLNRYIAAISIVIENKVDDIADGPILKSSKKKNLKPKHDPYLLKLQLDLQLKRQLLEEHYLQESYINLQKTGLELEKIVYLEIQKSLSRYSGLMDLQVRMTLSNLCNDLNQGILSKPPSVEWDKLVLTHPKCLLRWRSTDPIPSSRKLSDIIYPKMKSPLARCIRAGYLLKKNKYIKNYSKGYFVLTSNYLHEFKSSDFFKNHSNNRRSSSNNDTINEETDDDPLLTSNTKGLFSPIMSISLNDCALLEYNEEKFVIKTKSLDDIYFDNNSAAEKKNTIAMNEYNKTKSNKTYGLGKFWKRQSSSSSLVQPVANSSTSTTPVSTTWTFRKPSDVDQKDFQRWINDLKDLTSFHSSQDRAKFIEEQILLKRVSTHKVASGTTRRGKFKMRLDLPPRDFSQLSVNEMNKHTNQITPAIDDNGNLIMASDPKPVMPVTPSSDTLAPSQPQSLPQPQSVSKPDILVSQPDSFPSQDPVSSAPTVFPTSTSAPATAHTTPETEKDNNTSVIPSITVSANVGSTQPPAAVNNVSGGGGGYFSIPVRRPQSVAVSPGIPQTVQSAASVARSKLIRANATTPPSPPISIRSASAVPLSKPSSTTSMANTVSLPNNSGAANTFNSTNVNTGNMQQQQQQSHHPNKGHRKINSLSSLSSLVLTNASNHLKKAAAEGKSTTGKYLSSKSNNSSTYDLAQGNSNNSNSKIDVYKSLYGG